MQKSGVVFGVHDAEADVFAVQAFEGGAVTDHETLTDAGVEDVPGVRPGFWIFRRRKLRRPGRFCKWGYSPVL